MNLFELIKALQKEEEHYANWEVKADLDYCLLPGTVTIERDKDRQTITVVAGCCGT